MSFFSFILFFRLTFFFFFFFFFLSPLPPKLHSKSTIYLEQLGHLQETRVVVVAVAVVPAIALSFRVSCFRGLPLRLLLQVQRLFGLEQVPRLVALPLGRG